MLFSDSPNLNLHIMNCTLIAVVAMSYKTFILDIEDVFLSLNHQIRFWVFSIRNNHHIISLINFIVHSLGDGLVRATYFNLALLFLLILRAFAVIYFLTNGYSLLVICCCEVFHRS